jgi:hypothetical protein
MSFKKWVKSIQTAGYNGTRTVNNNTYLQYREQNGLYLDYRHQERALFQKKFQTFGLGQTFWGEIF